MDAMPVRSEMVDAESMTLRDSGETVLGAYVQAIERLAGARARVQKARTANHRNAARRDLALAEAECRRRRLEALAWATTAKRQPG
jgi:hypothetical protein